ncbi:MAG: GNAT family N-acetyltransferase [Treponema sp.]|nr:GNAT family N-acetyltransferase [Treponema sp.]
MKIEPKEVVLKDGRKCILRNAIGADAKSMLNYLRKSGGETEFILRYPDEVDKDYTVESEAKVLENVLVNPDVIMIVAEVDGKIAGNCGLHGSKKKRKTAHRAGFAIALMQEFWGLGIGTALMTYALELAENKLGYTVIDLEVVSENKRAIALYTKMGFKKIGERPMALKLDNGNYYSEDLMCRIQNGH